MLFGKRTYFDKFLIYTKEDMFGVCTDRTQLLRFRWHFLICGWRQDPEQFFPTHVSGERPRRRRKDFHKNVVRENSLKNCYRFILCLSESSSPPHMVYYSLEFFNRWVMDQNYINYLLFTINIFYLLFIIPIFIKFAFLQIVRMFGDYMNTNYYSDGWIVTVKKQKNIFKLLKNINKIIKFWVSVKY